MPSREGLKTFELVNDSTIFSLSKAAPIAVIQEKAAGHFNSVVRIHTESITTSSEL